MERCGGGTVRRGGGGRSAHAPRVAKNLVKLARYSATHFSMNACAHTSALESTLDILGT